MRDSLQHPRNHALRSGLHNEVHARPPEAMSSPLCITHVVMLCDGPQRNASRAHAANLLRDHHLAPPDEHSIHLRADLPAFRLRWELHTEFVTWTFSRSLAGCPLDVAPDGAERFVPQQWLAELPGHCLAAVQIWALPPNCGASEAIRQTLSQDAVVASRLIEGQADVYTDFALQPNGYSNALIIASAVRVKL